MKLWLIFYLTLNAFELYNQKKCQELTRDLANIFTIPEFQSYCNQGKVSEGKKCSFTEESLRGCREVSCEEGESCSSPLNGKSCEELNAGFNDYLFQKCNSYCRDKAEEESGVCIYDMDDTECSLKETCANMPPDRCNEFPVSDITKYCKKKSDENICEEAKIPKKKK